MPESSSALSLISKRLLAFLRMESSAGLILVAATVAAMLVKNSPLSDLYVQFLNLEGQIRVGVINVEKPLFLWVNDLWMAIFFFVIGLEIKNEWLHGHLKDRRQIILPAIGAIGGVAAPALIYLAVNWNSASTLRGWAIPTATDIAFALAVLTLLSNRVPTSLKIFLMTLAILDDLIAIVVIALFYTSGLSLVSISAAAIILFIMLCLRRSGVNNIAPYVLLGAVLWVCVLKSGVHATLAGVITAFFIPTGKSSEHNNLESLIEGLHPWVAFFVLPTFAFVNAGIDFTGMNFEKLLTPLPLGIFFGLVLGKALGVFGICFAAIKLGWTRLPTGSSWTQLFGISVLCGIGFTMSLFIGGLAFAEEGVGYARVDRLAIILASVVCAAVGYLILRFSASDRAE